MLDPNPRERLTLREAFEFANVPWFKSSMEHPTVAPLLDTPAPCPCRPRSYAESPPASAYCAYWFPEQFSAPPQGVYMQSLPPAASISQATSEQLSSRLRINGDTSDNNNNSSLLRWHARKRYTSQELAQIMPSEDEPSQHTSHSTVGALHSHAAHEEAQAPLWAGDVEVPDGCRVVAAGA